MRHAATALVKIRAHAHVTPTPIGLADTMEATTLYTLDQHGTGATRDACNTTTSNRVSATPPSFVVQ